MFRRHLPSLAAILALAVALTVFRVPLASSQGITLIAAQVAGDLPTADPGSPAWNQAAAVDVPLSAQNVAIPKVLETRVRSVTARALHNGTTVALLVEWADDTRDDQMVRVQDFRDSVAVQFPLAQGQPFFCMGQQGGNVNIWHWKADWQADIAARQDQESSYPDMYVDQYPFTTLANPALVAPGDYADPNYLPALAAGNLFASAKFASPVEDLVAGGYGSLTAQPADGQNVSGYGTWADGKWRVVFARDLVSAEADDVSFAAGSVYSMAFAVWDGANGERNGEKSTSQWVSLQLATAARAAGPAATAAGPSASTIEVILALFGPLLLVAGLVIGLAGAAFLLAQIPRRRE